MFKTCLFILYLSSVCASVTIEIHVGIIGPWRSIEIDSRHIDSQIIRKTIKRGFASKLVFPEDEEIEEDDQVDLIKSLAGLREIEMNSIGQLKVPWFLDLNLIRSIKLSGNQISFVDEKSFSQITPEYIDLRRNRINKIHDGAFGIELKTLLLDCNDLNTVSSSWFLDTDSLQSLHLRGNKITVIPANFKLFTSLADLYINYNKLNEIQDNALSQKHYAYIDVSYNNLTELKSSYFSSKKVVINYINLRANRFNYIPQDFMSKVNITVELTADLNPWLCPCNDLIRQWLPKIVLYNKKNSFLDAEIKDHAHRIDPFCVQYESGSQICQNEVDEESTKYYFQNIDPFDTEACPEY